MNIIYIAGQFTFSEISVTEFQAIREFMKLARLTADHHKFDINFCNTSDNRLNELGRKLSDQIRDFMISETDAMEID